MASISAILGPSGPESHGFSHITEQAASPLTRSPVQEEQDEDESRAPSPEDTIDGGRGYDEQQAAHGSTAVSSAKKGAKDVSSVYTGNKMKHLKKSDGIPLWRKDIQYDFLRLIFDDKTACFTKYSDGTKGHTFADIYIDAMAKSSKCSRILKEKLLADQEGAISMAMVCLLVNVNRMNTTLNFFPEMRAQLRTYHSIPALQAHQDPNAYKQLQDAPRLKSILKGATEDDPQPATLEEMKDTGKPRTNPVNLIFVMNQYATRMTEIHFSSPREFFDLIVRTTISSTSRARAFLWLLWWYLESDFTKQASLDNPFGPGQYGEGEEGTDAVPLKVPTLETLTEEQAARENVDTDNEQHFGEVKRKERIAILASEPSPAMQALKRARKEKNLANYSEDDTLIDGRGPDQRMVNLETGSERTRSPSPVSKEYGFQAVNTVHKSAPDMRINTLLNSEGPSSAAVSPVDGPAQSVPIASAPVKKGLGRGNWRRNKPKHESGRSGNHDGGAHHVPLLPNPGQYGFVTETPGPAQPIQPGPTSNAAGYGATRGLTSSAGSPARGTISFQTAHTASDHVPTPSYQAQKRSRGITQHQSAVINHRKQQIEYTLDRRIRRFHARMQDEREHEGSIVRAWKRVALATPDYDSEEDLVKYKKGAHKNEKDDGHDIQRRNAKDSIDDGLEISRVQKGMLYAGLGHMRSEPGDIGEEAKNIARALRRAARRLDRWQDERAPPGMVVIKRRHLQSRGLLQLQPQRHSNGALRQSSVDPDGTEMANEEDDEESHHKATGRQQQKNGNTATHQRGQHAGKYRGPLSSSKDPGKNEPPPLDDEDGGGEELDEEERELLGEVDADESSDEENDEDVAMKEYAY